MSVRSLPDPAFPLRYASMNSFGCMPLGSTTEPYALSACHRRKLDDSLRLRPPNFKKMHSLAFAAQCDFAAKLLCQVAFRRRSLARCPGRRLQRVSFRITRRPGAILAARRADSFVPTCQRTGCYSTLPGRSGQGASFVIFSGLFTFEDGWHAEWIAFSWRMLTCV